MPPLSGQPRRQQEMQRKKRLWSATVRQMVKWIFISENKKIEIFKRAILATNKLNEEIEGLIETGEREDLCELTDKITIACGLDPTTYGDGEGLASEWRAW